MMMTSHFKSADGKLLYTAKEACLIVFGTNDRTKLNLMYRLLKSGKIEAERVGNTWLISRKALVELHGQENLQ